jgi:hypothetical protein
MDTFSSYDNTLGFFVRTEVVNEMGVSNAAPYAKAAAVDPKSYRDSKGYRQIPIGYSGADVVGLSPYLQNYLACGAESVDFFAQNQYSWCDPSSFIISGYNTIYANASGYSGPIFFLGTGCNTNPPRTFGDQAAIFGSGMNDEWPGAIIYEWAMEANGYGIISYGPSSAISGTPTPVSPDFTNLQSQWTTLNPTGTPVISYDLATITPPACPTYASDGWLVHGNVKLSTLLQAAVVTKSSSASRTKTGSIQGLATLSSGTVAISASSNTAHSGGSASTGLSTGVKAGIAIGIIFIIVISRLVAFLLWRRRRNLPPQVPLDLSPEGLEVGSAPPKHEYENPSISTQEPHPAASELASSTNVPAELGSSTRSETLPTSSIFTTAELSTSPAIPKVHSVSPTKTFATAIPRHIVPTGTASSSWANTPWHSEESPIDVEKEAKAQEDPLLTTNDEEDELSRIEAEERRIDAQIAESERIRAVKEERAALQAKKAGLLAKREIPSKTW